MFGDADGRSFVCPASNDLAKPELTAAAPKNSRRVAIPYFVSDELGFFSEVLELAVLLESELEDFDSPEDFDSDDSPLEDPFPREEPEPFA